MARTIPGLLLAGGWLLLLLSGSFLVFWGVVVIIAILGSREYYQMVAGEEYSNLDQNVLSLIAALPILSTLFARSDTFLLGPYILLAFAILVLFVMYNYARFENPSDILIIGVFGIVYLGFFSSHLVLIHTVPGGTGWLILLTAITAGSDTGAYWIGRRWGKNKLCPSISPRKTKEGAVGGVCGGLLAALIVFWCLDVRTSVLMVLGLSIALSVIGMVGDLLESIIKRGTDTKDSGTILRGHGGILDRVDSLLFAGPFLYYIIFYLHLS